MSGPCPRIVIAGTGSGVGKTSVSLGLAAALVRRGLRVQTFKVGPDFLDPSYLAMASGRECYNLDGWMSDREYVIGLFDRTALDADIAIVEGVMGMFDGASPSALEGSTAEIAAWLDAPVLLVANAHGAARSMAATVAGFANFERGVRVAGVIANNCGSQRHRDWLADALKAADLPPLAGAIPRGALPTLQSRHLGLVSADASVLSRGMIDELANACEKHLDIDAILKLARSANVEVSGCTGFEDAGGQEPPRAGIEGASETGRVRIGVARDEAFHFYYPDNLQALVRQGAELVEFSPLADKSLPEGLDGLYIGGGYPEVHAARLSANASMLDSVRQFASGGGCIYAECGGLMYLGKSLLTLEGRRFGLVDVVPVETHMLGALKTLGYVEVTTAADSLWGRCGSTIRGHEFHYSKIVSDDSAAQGWRSAYVAKRRRDEPAAPEGYQKGRVLTSYIHLHFASRPGAVAGFINCCKEKS